MVVLFGLLEEAEVVAIFSLSSHFEHATKLTASKIFIKDVKFPLEPSRTFITGCNDDAESSRK